jgi:hypothetical protein
MTNDTTKFCTLRSDWQAGASSLSGARHARPSRGAQSLAAAAADCEPRRRDRHAVLPGEVRDGAIREELQRRPEGEILRLVAERRRRALPAVADPDARRVWRVAVAAEAEDVRLLRGRRDAAPRHGVRARRNLPQLRLGPERCVRNLRVDEPAAAALAAGDGDECVLLPAALEERGRLVAVRKHARRLARRALGRGLEVRREALDLAVRGGGIEDLALPVIVDEEGKVPDARVVRAELRRRRHARRDIAEGAKGRLGDGDALRVGHDVVVDLRDEGRGVGNIGMRRGA